MKAQRPFVLVNMAMSADGKIANADRSLSTFGSSRDHEHLLDLRAKADAVMCGARTADSASVTLGPGGSKYQRRRVRAGLQQYNLRIIVSGSGSIDLDAKVFQRRFSPIIILTSQRAPKSKIAVLKRAADAVGVFGEREVALKRAMSWLRREWSVKRLLCEGGGKLNMAMLRAGLVDELHLTICPIILGGRNAPTLADGVGFESLAKAATLQLKSRRRVGDELFLRYLISSSH